jgi:hypothetical protein
MRIDIDKYGLTLDQYGKLLDKVTKISTPRGYKVLNAREYKKENKGVKKRK